MTEKAKTHGTWVNNKIWRQDGNSLCRALITDPQVPVNTLQAVCPVGNPVGNNSHAYIYTTLWTDAHINRDLEQTCLCCWQVQHYGTTAQRVEESRLQHTPETRQTPLSAPRCVVDFLSASASLQHQPTTLHSHKVQHEACSRPCSQYAFFAATTMHLLFQLHNFNAFV